jgi:TonB family protein
VKFNQVSIVLRASMIACSVIFALSSDAICQQQETAEQFIERVKKAIENDEWGRAQGGVKHALALKPKSPEALFLAAQVYLHEGARSMAIESLSKAIETQAVYPEAHFLLARCLLDSGKTENAREEANIAIGQGASLFPAYRLLGEIDFAEGKYEAATAPFETALRFAQASDEKEAAKLQRELEDLRVLIENLKRFGALEAEQKSPDVIRPVPLNNPPPRYTKEASDLKIQGAVSMVVLVTENGDVDSVVLVRRLGHGLDEGAIETARELKFSPARRNGKPIPFWMKVMIEFYLR